MAQEYTELEDLGNDIFLCKVLWQHAWDKNPTPKNIDGEIANMASVILALRCRRCRRERYDYLDSHGGRIGRYYVNPVNYPKTHRHSGEELMAELIRRTLWVSEA